MNLLENIKNKILIPFRLIPKDGLTAHDLALSVTIGVVSGLFPVFGATTLLSILLTFLFRQNLIVVQSVQWLLGLIQVILIIPFMQIGAFLLSQPEIVINTEQINIAFEPGILAGIRTLGIYHLYAILSWSVLILPSGIVSYFAFLKVFQRAASRA